MTASMEMIKAAPVLDPKIIESIVLRGDISELTPEQKVAYANHLAVSVGLDPVTTPFKSVKLQGGEKMYADKGTCEQLRRLHKISIEIRARERIDDVFCVTAHATMPDGRSDESQGVVSIGNLKGDAMANAVMKAETKAKRRVTLSIVGLGMLDESELDTIDRFAAMPPEQPRTAGELGPKIVTLDKKGAAVPQAQIDKERKPAKKGEALGKLPAKIVDIPAAILLSVKPLHGLEGVPLAKMTDEDLELVAEQMAKVREVWKVTASSQRALDWLDAIGKEAKHLLGARNGDVAPPPDDDDGHGSTDTNEDDPDNVADSDRGNR